jgi:hypothetical protein
MVHFSELILDISIRTKTGSYKIAAKFGERGSPS